MYEDSENLAFLLELRIVHEKKGEGLGSSPSDGGVQERPAGLFSEDARSGEEACGLCQCVLDVCLSYWGCFEPVWDDYGAN